MTSTATSTSTPSRNRAVSARSPPGLGIDVGEEGRQGQLGVLVVAFGHSGPGSTLSRTRYAPTARIESGVDVTQVRTRLAFAPGDRLRSRGPTRCATRDGDYWVATAESGGVTQTRRLDQLPATLAEPST
jgi:hypothetical protein